MKELLALIPCMILAACGGAADITGDEAFQITCTWTDKGGKSSDETYFVDPKLDLAVLEFEDADFEDAEYFVTKVTPRKIVISSDWGTPLDEGDHYRDENVIDRSTGILTPSRYELKRDLTYEPLLAEGWEGTKVDLDYEYDCKKPTR